MGSFIKLLNLDFINNKIAHREELKEKNDKIQELKDEINMLKLTDEEKANLNQKIQNLPSLFRNISSISLPNAFQFPSFANLAIDFSQFEKLNERINAMSSILPEVDPINNNEEQKE